MEKEYGANYGTGYWIDNKHKCFECEKIFAINEIVYTHDAKDNPRILYYHLCENCHNTVMKNNP